MVFLDYIVHQFVPYTQAKTLRGEKILSPRCFLLGGGAIAPSPPGSTPLVMGLCVSVTHAGIVSKQLHGTSWFFTCRLPSRLYFKEKCESKK